MVVSWLGINRFYFIISMKQSICHKFPFQDDTNLQALTVIASMNDSRTDKYADTNCKKNFTICGHKSESALSM